MIFRADSINEIVILDAGEGADTIMVDKSVTKNLNFDMGIGNDFIDIASESTTQITTLTGGEGDDVIVGGAGVDTIYGDAGEDLIMGMGGDDIIDGGDNDDTIEGGDGADTIHGGNETPVELNGRLQGGDTIIGGAGNDMLYGQGGIDTIEGGEDNDTIYGGDDGDRIRGGAGDDDIFGEDGDDDIIGGFGVDTIDAGSGSDVIAWYKAAEILDEQGEVVGTADEGDDDLIDGGADEDLFKIISDDLADDILVDPTGIADQIRLAWASGGPALIATNIDNVDLDLAGGGDTVTVDPLINAGVTNLDIDLGITTVVTQETTPIIDQVKDVSPIALDGENLIGLLKGSAGGVATVTVDRESNASLTEIQELVIDADSGFFTLEYDGRTRTPLLLMRMRLRSPKP